jgi:DNA-binding transcriptional regulator GbsR (MarR family)
VGNRKTAVSHWVVILEATMFGWFKQSPEKKLQKQIDTKRTEALKLQRSGKLRESATLTSEIEALEDELIALDDA